MDRNRQNPYYLAGYSPEESRHQGSDYHRHRRDSTSLEEVGFRAPQSPSASLADQAALALSRLALSRLALSSDVRQETALFHHLPGIDGDVAAVGWGTRFPMGSFYPLDAGDQGLKNNVCFQGGFQGHGGQGLSFPGAHRDPTMGHGPWVCGPGPVPRFDGAPVRSDPWSIDQSASMRLNNSDLGQGFYDHGCSFLQCKQSLSSRADEQFPTLPSLNWYGLSRLNLGGNLNSLESKDSSFIRPNSLKNRQLYARNKHQLDGISLQDLRGLIVSMSKDQNGSKILEEKLDSPNEEDIEMVLREATECIADLMKSQYGSYFVQKLFGVCSEEQRTRIIVAVTTNSLQLVDVCLNLNGARVVQKLLENLSTPEQISLVVSAISPGGVALANDPNGQHIVRYCLIHYPYEYHKHLLNKIANNCCKIATDKSGCCVLQSCVEHAHGEPKERLIQEIIANALLLTEDPYGNYVVQHLLGLKMPEVTALLLSQLLGNFVALSCDKYGSNVVEKFLMEAGKEHSTAIIKELLMSPNASSVLVNPYGNFVIQKALSIAKGDVFFALQSLIQMNAPSLRSNIYGKKVLAWFEKRKHMNVV